MKAAERKEACQLRRKGCSLSEIVAKLGCSKASVSKWVRDIPLTESQIENLRRKQDRARAKAANHPHSARQVWQKIRNDIENASFAEIASQYDSYLLKILGSALYWAEGYKRSRNMVVFSNSDPEMIKLMMRFFRQVCGVPEEKFRGCVQLHSHLDGRAALHFWSQTSGISLRQFHKLQTPLNRASKNKRDTLPRGTFRIIISDTRLQSKIKGWIEGIKKWANSSAG